MPRAFNDRERERINEKLLAAGRAAINRAGVRQLAIDDVVREAGISKGSFYSFYPSREDFILSVLESWEAEYRGELVRGITEGGGSFRQRLERFFLGALEIFEREPGLARLGINEIRAITDRLPPERIAAHQAADNRVIEEAFRRWADHGLLPADVLEAFWGLVPALFSIAVHREDFPRGTYRPAVKLIAEALALRLTPAGARED
ncbi:MAG TPA: TetR/AcrR family transcriptional regulator [Spirochaetia bacterium]|nr:TetR/AcrR family transcriptional regulator [Spirochaetia bacterium]